MATKKSFTDHIKKGQLLDEALRSSGPKEGIDRFEIMEQALAGRGSLLHAPKETDVSSRADVLVREGKASVLVTTWPIDKIDDNPLNSRHIYDEAKVQARASSIAKDGQFQPALVARHPTNPERVILIDGQYRKRASRILGKKEMEVKILDGLTPIDFWRLARSSNAEREQESALDVAMSFRALLDQGHARTAEEIAGMIGESKGVVSKYLAMLSLPEQTRDIIAAHPAIFSVNISYELALYRKVTDDSRTDALAQRILDDGLSIRKIEAIRKAAEVGKERRRNPTSLQFKFRGADGTEIGTIKEWADGRIQVDLQLGNDVVRFREALTTMLAEGGAQSIGEKSNE
ncbi:ParB/RepB/Spo0J family partition protein [Burkholderia glumae]|uniref:ParB/RepB/Spo0J family partition protein n=1 Tax=Burkholderia glumae TaxID=337 RepID=A0AAP9Y574_BURGL|nr:ParB/RepB/Spo0J family partition protein [Burkholderia glumae]AJY62437.1 ParB/RepB/Spo0J family partition domain protein [Burkholderia glumae LMG 2196 = ATCC 33617]KHJ63773.1 chromosome partitioning protein ParB [Burkholderia glumae]MCM2496168.1 ParB/RepB/Spo0J family partition protein [Burkholderia glumae]MCQ0034503.1 ParB/RepB/Spo0J family partition protein [Burkholderia glumae]MCQ0039668.1 ParB/RepB/Spo0J family partition protein [Burkholderia glumae]